jgi:hypothetical protein
MKISNRWVIPLAVAVLTFSIGGAAFAMSGSSSTDTTASGTVATAADTSSAAATQDSTNTTAASTTDKDWGKHGNNGETALTGDTLAQVQAAALAAAGSGSTLISATNETDNSDSSIKYEAFVKQSDGTAVKMYLDASFKVVSTENAQQGGKHHGGADSDGAPNSATGTSSSTGSI